jgi:hypothetical protein
MGVIKNLLSVLDYFTLGDRVFLCTGFMQLVGDARNHKAANTRTDAYISDFEVVAVLICTSRISSKCLVGGLTKRDFLPYKLSSLQEFESFILKIKISVNEDISVYFMHTHDI